MIYEAKIVKKIEDISSIIGSCNRTGYLFVQEKWTNHIIKIKLNSLNHARSVRRSNLWFKKTENEIYKFYSFDEKLDIMTEVSINQDDDSIKTLVLSLYKGGGSSSKNKQIFQKKIFIDSPNFLRIYDSKILRNPKKKEDLTVVISSSYKKLICIDITNRMIKLLAFDKGEELLEFYYIVNNSDFSELFVNDSKLRIHKLKYA